MELFKSIPLSTHEARQCWRKFYSDARACDHAFQQNFDADISELDVAAATVGPATLPKGGDDALQLGRHSFPSTVIQSSSETLVTTTAVTGETIA